MTKFTLLSRMKLELIV